MVAVNAIRDTYRLEASATGVEATTAAAQKLAGATDAVAVSSERQERRVLSVEKALERFAAANDKAFRTQQVLARGQAILDRAQEQGLSGSLAYQRAVAGLAEKQALLARSAATATAANDNLAASYATQSSLLTGVSSGYGKLVSLVTALGAAYAAAEFVRTVTSFQAIENSLKAATGSTEAAQSAMGYVRAESDRLGLSLASTAKDFTSFAASTRGTELEGEKTRKVFSAVAEAGTVLGLSADTMSGALMALTQMASKGTVQSEELRGQLGERLPGAFNIAARAMGVTTAELGKMLDAGQLMAADFLPKFADELHKTFGPQAAAAADSLAANLNRLQTAVTDLFLAAGKGGLTEALNDAVKQSVAFLQTNQGTAASVGGTLASALRAGGAAFDFLRRNADLAAAALAGLLALRFGPSVVGVAVEIGRAASMMGVYDIATRQLVVGQTAAVASSRALSVAMGALGGPVGLVLTAAAAAVTYLALRQDDGAKTAEAHAASLKQLDSALQQSKGNLAGAADETKRLAAEQIAAAQAAVQIAQARLTSAEALAQAGRAQISFGAEDALLGGAAQAGLENDTILRASELAAAKEKLAATFRLVAGAASEADRALLGLPSTINASTAAVDAAIPRLQVYADAMSKLIAMVPQLQAAVDASSKLAAAKSAFDTGLTALEKGKLSGEISADEFSAKQEQLRKTYEQSTQTVSGYADAQDKLEKRTRAATIGAMEPQQAEIARLRDAQSEYVKSLDDGASSTMAAAQRNDLIARSEKVLAQEVANVNSKYAEKAAKAAASNSGSDAYDNAMQRSRDQVQELEEQARAASKTSEEIYRLTEANRLRRAAASAGRSEEAGVAEAIDEQAAAYARARKASEDAVEAQRRLQEGQREVAADFGRFADDVILGGEKMDAAFKSLAKTFASGGLNALLTGSGPLAGLLGTAPTEKGQVGGLLGGQLNLGKLFDTAGLKDAVGEGTFAGVSDFFGPLLKPKVGPNGQQGGFMSTPLGTGLTAVGVGASIGYSSQSPVIGGVGGAIAGGMAGAAFGPLGIAAGAFLGGAAGVIGGITGENDRKKEAKRRIDEQLKAYAEALKEARPQIDLLSSTFLGRGTGGVTAQINSAFQEMYKANVTASRGGDQATADRLVKEFETYMGRLRTQFAAKFQGALKDLGAGQGLDGAFTQAANNIATLGEALKSFIEDASHLPDAAASVAQARAAAQEAALGSLEPSKTLSSTQTELARIAGTAAGLTQVLTDLGMTADQAATAIAERTTKAIDALRTSFSDDLERKINDAGGKDYQNSILDLLKERQTMLADAASLGADSSRVETYFGLAAQKIVNEAELTGDAFTDLTKAFPALTGRVTEFSAAVDTAAAKTAAAARALSYQDRQFAAGNDASTLYGQLVAFNRKAQAEIVEEQKAGGQAMADLLATQNAERLKLEEDYYASVRDAQIQALEQARQAYDSFAKNIRQYLDGLRAGSGSPLSPQARLAAAQSQYAAQLTLAQGGNRDALDGITGYASDLLDAAKSFYASSTAFQTIFGQVQQQLGALPTQVSPEQFIVNAITDAKTATVTATQAMQAALKQAIDAGSGSSVATALLPQFNTLTSATNGLLNYQQFLQATGGLATVSEQQAARGIFQSIDLDGDGQISKLELIRAQAVTGNQIGSDGNTALGAINFNGQLGAAKAETGNQILTGINSQAAGTKSGVDTSNNQLNAVNYNGQLGNVKIGDTNSILGAINGLAAVQRDQLIALNNQFSVNANLSINGQALNNNIVTALNKIVYNTAGTWSAVQKGAVPAAYSTGGWVNGPGTATSDSIPAMLSAGEYVVKADVARMHGSLLETLNGTGTLQLQAMNDNRLGGMMAPPMVMPMPVPMAAGGYDTGVLVAEMRQQNALLRQQVALLQQHIRVSAAAAEDNREGLDDVKGAVNDAGRAQRLLAA